MSKRKYSPEWALARVQEYLSGQGSVNGIAAANGMDKKTLRVWVAKYREQGVKSKFVCKFPQVNFPGANAPLNYHAAYADGTVKGAEGGRSLYP